MSTDPRLEEVLQRWSEARERMAALSDSIDTYKSVVSRLMDKRGVDTLSTRNYKVMRKKGVRSVISRKDVPASVWHQYARETYYDSIHLRET
jgi:hypothetical protein